MTNENRPLKVFLCHAHNDKSKARELYRYLKRRGIQPWLDVEKLLPGQNWQTEIPRALEASDAIIICLSKESVDKEGYIQKEIKFALDKALEMPEGRIFLIPARLEECNVPNSLSNYHWVDLFETTGYTKLMRSLKIRASDLKRAVVELHLPGETSPNSSSKVKQEQQNGLGLIGDYDSVIQPSPTQILKQQKAPKSNLYSRITGINGIVSVIRNKSAYALQHKQVIVAIAIVFLFVLVIFLSNRFNGLAPRSLATSTYIPSLSTLTQVESPTLTPTPSPTLTRTPTPTSTPTPLSITGDNFSEIALLGKITPAGNETFGSSDISRDGQLIAVVVNLNNITSSIQLWKWETNNFVLWRTLSIQNYFVTNIIFSPDGKRLASGADDGTLRIWQVEDGKPISTCRDSKERIQKIGFSKDGQKLVVALESRLEVWDIVTGKLLNAKNIVLYSNQSIQSFAVSPNDEVGYTLYERSARTVYPWDPISQKYSKTPIQEWSGTYRTYYGSLDDLKQLPQIDSVVFFQVSNSSQDGKTLATSWGGGDIRILDLRDLANKGSAYFCCYGSILDLEFSPDNSSIAIASYSDPKLSLLHISDHNVVAIPWDDKLPITNLAFSWNGWFLISSSDTSLKIWGLPRWNSTPTPTLAPPTPLR